MPLLFEQVRELRSLLLVEHSVNTPDGIDRRGTHLRGRVVDVPEHRTQRGIIERAATHCRCKITPHILYPIARRAYSILQPVELTDDDALLCRRRIET